MPDRLPSLIVLVAFWVPPAVAGWVAAGPHRRSTKPTRSTFAVMAAFVLCYSAVWFLLNLRAMPPYIPGAVMDPTVATPRSIAWLAVVSAALVQPVSALACMLAFRARLRTLDRTTAA